MTMLHDDKKIVYTMKNLSSYDKKSIITVIVVLHKLQKIFVMFPKFRIYLSCFWIKLFIISLCLIENIFYFSLEVPIKTDLSRKPTNCWGCCLHHGCCKNKHLCLTICHFLDRQDINHHEFYYINLIFTLHVLQLLICLFFVLRQQHSWDWVVHIPTGQDNIGQVHYITNSRMTVWNKGRNIFLWLFNENLC